MEVTNSATVFTEWASSTARGSSARSSTRSERSVAMQLGSMPTTVLPSLTCGSRTSSVLRSRALAAVSWPVETRVRPQQAPGPAISTSQPAAKRTSRASRGMSGSMASEKESTQSTTLAPVCFADLVGGLLRRNGFRGSVGSERRGSAPITAVMALRSSGTRPARLTSGASGAASLSHCGSRPSV